MGGFLELARARWSVRSFSSRQVEPEKLQLILKTSPIAPTAVKYQLKKIIPCYCHSGQPERVDILSVMRYGGTVNVVIVMLPLHKTIGQGKLANHPVITG